MQLPSRLEAFVDEQRQVNKRVESDISGLKAGQKELRTGQSRSCKQARRGSRPE